MTRAQTLPARVAHDMQDMVDAFSDEAGCSPAHSMARSSVRLTEVHMTCSIIVDRLRREFKVDCDVGAPQVNYRESISRKADIRYVHKKQSGGSGQFADIAVRFEPGEPGTGFEFRSEIKGGVVPKV